MPAISPEETVLRFTGANHEPINLRVEAGQPVTVRVEVERNCSCQAGPRSRPGSYTDIDFGAGR